MGSGQKKVSEVYDRWIRHSRHYICVATRRRGDASPLTRKVIRRIGGVDNGEW